jgi:hypothetical protein
MMMVSELLISVSTLLLLFHSKLPHKRIDVKICNANCLAPCQVNLPLKVKRFQIKVRVEGNGTNLGRSCRVRTVGRRRQGGATGKPSQRSLSQVASPVAFSTGKRANCLCLPQSSINSIMDHPLRLSLSYNNRSCLLPTSLYTSSRRERKKNQLTVVCYRVYLTKPSCENI